MTNTEMFSDELKQAIREFIATSGRPVLGRTQISFYGWTDYTAQEHATTRGGKPGCAWLVPEGTFLYEESYDQFQGTFYEGDTSEDGINVSGCRCSCGKLTDVTLRWEGTLAELINHLVPKDESKTKKGWTL